MTCVEFQNRLDIERPDADMKEHARVCSRCEGQLQAAMEIEEALGVIVPARVQAGFSEAVLQKIQAARQPHWRGFIGSCQQILADPFVSASIAVSIVVAWMHDIIAAAAVALVSETGALLLALSLMISVAIVSAALIGGGPAPAQSRSRLRSRLR